MVTKKSPAQIKADAKKAADLKKANDLRKKVVKGTTEPLPKDEGTQEQKEASKRAVEMAAEQRTEREAAEKKQKDELEKKRDLLKKLQAELKAANDAVKKERDRVKDEKKKEKDKTIAERMEKEKLLEVADKAVKRAQEELELTEEWRNLAKAKEAREKIGPLPKIRKSSGGGGGPRRGGANGLTSKMIKLLEAMEDGEERGSAALAEASGINKGKPFPLMEEMGLIESSLQEGVRGKLFCITDKGIADLEKAKAELVAKAEAPKEESKSE